MDPYAFRSVTTNPGDAPSDPRRRVQSECTVPRVSPVSEPLGERTGVPPRAALPSCRDVALARPPQASTLLETGETGSQSHPKTNTVHVSSSGIDDLTYSKSIFRRGDDFVFVDSGGTGAFLVPRWHLHLCLEYSKQIRWVMFANRIPDPPPIGYDIVTRTYNAEPNFGSCFSEFDEKGKWLVRMTHHPSPYTFFGNVPPPPPLTAMDRRAAEITAAIADSAMARRRRIARRMEGGTRRQWRGHALPAFGSRGRGDGAIGGDRRGGIRGQGSGFGRRRGPPRSRIEENTGPEAGPSVGPSRV